MSSKVKTIETRIQTKDDQNYLSEISEIDLYGNTTLNKEYNSEGELESSIESLFDSEGRLIEQKQLIENGELADHKFHFRNESGEIIRTETLFQGGSKSIQTMVFDQEKNTEELLEVDEDGELESKEINHLSEEKHIELKEIYNYDNKLTEAFKYEYDQKGQLIRRDQLDHRKKLLVYTEYEYDESGRTVFRANRTRKGRLSEFLKTEYDENGAVIKQNFSGKFFFIFEYDKKGNTVLEERYNTDDQMEYQSRFEYDENNLLQREVNLEFTRELSYQFHEE